jgi:hypothetical protein
MEFASRIILWLARRLDSSEKPGCGMKKSEHRLLVSKRWFGMMIAE